MKKPKFLVDTMLGRLAVWLRILGFDASFVKETQRKRMLERSFLERRILVTREAKLANAHVWKLVLIRDQYWPDQLAHLWKELKLEAVCRQAVFSRCTECNRPLKKIPKSKIDPKKIPPKVFEFQQEFYFCEKCRKIFWSGSHVDKTMARLKEIGIPVNL